MLLDEQCDYCNDEKQINDDDMIVNLAQNKLQNGQYFYYGSIDTNYASADRIHFIQKYLKLTGLEKIILRPEHIHLDPEAKRRYINLLY